MATAQKEIPIDDAELDDLMAQLEAETAGAVDAPVAAAAPVTATADDDVDTLAAELEANGDPDMKPIADPDDQDIAELAAQLDDTPFEPVEADPKKAEMDAKLATIAAQLNKTKAAAPAPDADAELAALEAELNETPAPASTPVAAAAAPAPEPEPEPVVHLEGQAALQAVVEAVEKEAPRTAPPAAPAAAKKELNHYIDMADFRNDIKVSSTNLDDCMMQQAGLRAYHGEQAAHADAQHSRLKLRHEVVEARLYDKHRKALALTGEKVTEKMVENAVKQDPEYVSSKNRVIEAETIAAVRRACTDALKDRKDMLVQLGADRREDGKGQLRILAAEGSHQDKRVAAAAALRSA